jgi:hypothetical protein
MTVVVSASIPAAQRNDPRVLWPRHAPASIVVSSAAPLYDGAFAAQPQTYSSWKPTSGTSTIEFDYGVPRPVDSCGIGAHTLFTAGSTVTVQRWTGAAWATVATFAVTSNRAVLFLFPEVTAQRWRLSITGAAAPEIGFLCFSKAMVLPRATRFAPDTPITEAEQYTYNVNRTQTGTWAGRSVSSSGLRFEVRCSNVPESFAAGDWAAFRAHCNVGDGTFFIAPKPQGYPEEVAYAMPTDTLAAGRARSNAAISRDIELACEGYLAP